MNEARTAYGFPFASDAEIMALLGTHMGAVLIGFGANPASKLERAQAIAAEVRARKFPPVVRLTPMEKL